MFFDFKPHPQTKTYAPNYQSPFWLLFQQKLTSFGILLESHITKHLDEKIPENYRKSNLQTCLQIWKLKGHGCAGNIASAVSLLIPRLAKAWTKANCFDEGWLVGGSATQLKHTLGIQSPPENGNGTQILCWGGDWDTQSSSDKVIGSPQIYEKVKSDQLGSFPK